MAASHPVQVVVDERDQILERLPIPLLPGVEKACHLTRGRGCRGHAGTIFLQVRLGRGPLRVGSFSFPSPHFTREARRNSCFHRMLGESRVW
jgi:hypothetical protein